MRAARYMERKIGSTSSRQKMTHPDLRPHLSVSTPRKVPNTADDKKPVMNSVPTLTPYEEYSVYMLVPCSQSASITTKYTPRYCAWNMRKLSVTCCFLTPSRRPALSAKKNVPASSAMSATSASIVRSAHAYDGL